MVPDVINKAVVAASAVIVPDVIDKAVVAASSVIVPDVVDEAAVAAAHVLKVEPAVRVAQHCVLPIRVKMLKHIFVLLIFRYSFCVP